MPTSIWNPTYVDYSLSNIYSVTFTRIDLVDGETNSFNTFTDWHLIPNSRPVISMPEQKKQMVDVPGGNSVVDLSMSLNKYPLFNRRSGTLTFTVNPDYDAESIRQDLVYKLHGRRMNMTLSDDPNFYYTGYFSVVWTSNEDGSSPQVEIEYDLEPYKTAQAITYINNLFNVSAGSASTPFTVSRTSTRPNLEVYSNQLPITFPTPLIVIVSNLSGNAQCDIDFGNSYLGIKKPNTTGTDTIGTGSNVTANSHYVVNKNGTYTITKYPISSRNSTSNKIYITVNNSSYFMPTTGSPSMKMLFGYRRKLL